MKKILIVNMLIALVLMGCSSTPTKQARYSSEEESKLYFCTALSDIAFVVATRKKDGVSKTKVREEYSSVKDTKLIYAIIDKVYADEIYSTVDYQKAFFNWCGVEVAEVSPNRMKLASLCNDIQFLSGIVYSMKNKGTSRSQAKAELNAKPGDILSTIVDTVYDSNGSLSDVKSAMWNACIKTNN